MLRLSGVVLLLLLLLPGAAWSSGWPTDPVYDEAIAGGGVLDAIRWQPVTQATLADGYGTGVGIVVIDTGVVTRTSASADAPGEFTDAFRVEADSGSCTTGGWRPMMGANQLHPDVIDDPRGHGTTVASLAVGRVNGQFGVGVAPEARLTVVKVDITRGNAPTQLGCAAWAAARSLVRSGGVGVVNLSLTVGMSRTAAAALLAPVVRAGGLVVASVQENGEPVLPAAAPHVLAVDVPRRPADLYRRVDVLAPGAGPGIRIVDAGGVDASYGSAPAAEPNTSWAAAVASGAAAYLMSRVPGTAQQTAWRLRRANGGRARLLDLAAAAKVKAPADDEVEPNDNLGQATTRYRLPDGAGAPWSGSCLRSSCPSFSGILAATSDPADVWVVGTPRGRRLCAVVAPSSKKGVTARIDRLSARSFAITVRPRVALTSYRVVPRLCSGKARVSVVARVASR